MKTTTTKSQQQQQQVASSSCCMSLAQKVPPIELETTLDGLRTIICNNNNNNGVKQINNDIDLLMNQYYIPFDVVDKMDVQYEKPFLLCNYNRIGTYNNTTEDGNQYRSPWTNQIHTIKSKIDSNTTNNKKNPRTFRISTSSMMEKTPTQPPAGNVLEEDELLRELEIQFNDVWDSYKNLYYGYEAIGSVYCKRMKKNQHPTATITTTTTTTYVSSFESIFGIRKRCVGTDSTGSGGGSNGGSWDSCSYVQVNVKEMSDGMMLECTYQIETTVRVVLVSTLLSNHINDIKKNENSTTQTTTDISVTLSKCSPIRVIQIQIEKVPMLNRTHIETIGTIIEDNEMELRSIMETVYIPKNYETIQLLQTMKCHTVGKNLGGSGSSDHDKTKTSNKSKYQQQQQPSSSSFTNKKNPVMNLMIDSGMLQKRLQQMEVVQQNNHNDNNNSNSQNKEKHYHSNHTTTTTTTSATKPSTATSSTSSSSTRAPGSKSTKMMFSSSHQQHPPGRPGGGGGINPLMMDAMNSKILLRKKQQLEQQEQQQQGEED